MRLQVLATLVLACAATDVVVRFRESNDKPLSGTYDTRHQLRDVLVAHATGTQARAVQILQSAGTGYRSMWIDNSIAVKDASPLLIANLTALDEVASVTPDGRVASSSTLAHAP